MAPKWISHKTYNIKGDGVCSCALGCLPASSSEEYSLCNISSIFFIDVEREKVVFVKFTAMVENDYHAACVALSDVFESTHCDNGQFHSGPNAIT